MHQTLAVDDCVGQNGRAFDDPSPDNLVNIIVLALYTKLARVAWAVLRLGIASSAGGCAVAA